MDLLASFVFERLGPKIEITKFQICCELYSYLTCESSRKCPIFSAFRIFVSLIFSSDSSSCELELESSWLISLIIFNNLKIISE